MKQQYSYSIASRHRIPTLEFHRDNVYIIAPIWRRAIFGAKSLLWRAKIWRVYNL